MKPSAPHDYQRVFSLMKKAYEWGAWCLDLPSPSHLKSFRELRRLTEDANLIGLVHLGAEESVMLLGKPIEHFEPIITSTIRKSLFSPQLIQGFKKKGIWTSSLFFPFPATSEILTQKEIDRIAFDPSRLDRALSDFHPDESPYLLCGGRYGDWLLGLGRVDLFEKMALKIRERGFSPIFWGRWATYVLPKVKSLDFAAYAVPVNMNWSLFDQEQACTLFKKFDRSLISLNPLADGKLLRRVDDAFSFLFEELRIPSAIVEIGSEEEGTKIVESLGRFPSIMPPKKT